MSYPFDRWSAPVVALILLTLVLLATCNPALSEPIATPKGAFKPAQFYPLVSSWNGGATEGVGENIIAAQVSELYNPGMYLFGDRLQLLANFTVRGAGHVEKYSSPLVGLDFEPEVFGRSYLTPNLTLDLAYRHSSNGLAGEGSESFDTAMLRLNGTDTLGPLFFDLHLQAQWLFNGGDIRSWEIKRGIEESRFAIDGWGTAHYDDEAMAYFDLRNNYAELFVGINARWLDWIAGFSGPENVYMGVGGFTGQSQFNIEEFVDRLQFGIAIVE